jgi:hypothetical protein
MLPSKTCDYAGYAPPPHYAEIYASLGRTAHLMSGKKKASKGAHGGSVGQLDDWQWVSSLHSRGAFIGSKLPLLKFPSMRIGVSTTAAVLAMALLLTNAPSLPPPMLRITRHCCLAVGQFNAGALLGGAWCYLGGWGL